MTPEIYTQLLSAYKAYPMLINNGLKLDIKIEESRPKDEYVKTNFDGKHNVEELKLYVDRFDYKRESHLEVVKQRLNSGYYDTEEFIHLLVEKLSS